MACKPLKELKCVQIIKLNDLIVFKNENCNFDLDQILKHEGHTSNQFNFLKIKLTKENSLLKCVLGMS